MKLGMPREQRLEWEREELRAAIADGGTKQFVTESWLRTTLQRKSAFYLRMADLSEQDRLAWDRLPDGRMLYQPALEMMYRGVENHIREAKKQDRPPTVAGLRAWWEEFQDELL